MASTLGDMVPVGLDTLSGATDGSQISNSRSEPPNFSCKESETKIDVLGDSEQIDEILQGTWPTTLSDLQMATVNKSWGLLSSILHGSSSLTTASSRGPWRQIRKYRSFSQMHN